MITNLNIQKIYTKITFKKRKKNNQNINFYYDCYDSFCFKAKYKILNYETSLNL